MNIFKLFRKSSGTGAPPTSATGTADLWINSPIIENLTGVVATTKLFKGCLVAGTGIPVGSRVIDILNATTVVIDNNVTATGAAVSVTFSELFPYGALATDGTNLYYGSQSNVPIKTVAGSGVIAETIDGLKTFLTRVKSGSLTLNDTPPIDNNDLTRKDFVENIIANSTRQFIIEGRKGQVYSDFIELGTGLTATAKASTGFPLTVSAANGQTAPRDYISRSIADIPFTGLTDHAENFLLLERNGLTGTFEPKSTILAPIYDELRSGSDREGKVYIAGDTGTVGTTFFPNAYNNNAEEGVTQNFNVTLQANPIVSGTVSLRFDNTLTPKPFIATPFQRMSALKGDCEYNQWTIGVFFNLDDPTTNATGVHTIFKMSDLHVYVDPADRLIKINTAINQGTSPVSMYNPIITAGTYTIPGNGNPLGLGITGPGGQILAGNNYHLAIQYDGVFMVVFLNGIVAGEFSYIDQAAANIESNIVYYVGKEWTTAYDTRVFLGSYDGNSNVAKGNFQHWVIDPYPRYRPYGDTLPLTVLNQSFIPTIATCTADNFRTDRNIVPRVIGNSAIMFNFEAPNHETRVEDYYGNKMMLLGAESYSYISTAQSKFGGSSLRFSGNDFVSGAARFKSPNLFAYLGTWTLEFWVRPDSGSIVPYQHILRTDPYSLSDAINIIWYPETSGTPRKLSVVMRDPANSVFFNLAFSTNDVTEDNWNHIAITYDGDVHKLFINGNFEISNPANSGSIVKNFDWFYLGTESQVTNSPNALKGYIDDFCFLPVCKYTTAFLNPTAPNQPLDYGATIPAGSTNVPGTYQYYYDIQTAKMYKGFNGNYNPTNAVFIGEVLCSGGSARQTVSYTVGTKLRTEKYNDYVDANAAMQFYHNFGTNKVSGILKYKGRRLNSSAAGSESEIGWTNRQATGIAALWYHTDNLYRNSSLHRTGNDATAGSFNFHSPIGAGIGSTTTFSGQNTSAIFVEFERNF
jgi:hypothetical protein